MAPAVKGKVPWGITLTQVDNGGLIVQVGCKHLVFEDPLMAIRELGRLYEQPNSVIEEYSRKYGWPTEALVNRREEAAAIAASGVAAIRPERDAPAELGAIPGLPAPGSPF